MKSVMLLVIGVAMSMLTVQKAKIEDVAWLEGSWTCQKWGGTFEEHWIGPSGGTMQGVGRLTGGGKTNFMEFLSIEPVGESLTMWILLGAPSQGSKKGVPFKLTKASSTENVWENPENDFPSKITYTKKSAESIHCRIEGVQDGKPAGEDFEFKRIKK